MPVTFVPRCARVAGTEPDPYSVPTVHVDDGEVARCGSYGTWVTIMTKMANEVERIEGGPLKEPVLPVLGTKLIRY